MLRRRRRRKAAAELDYWRRRRAAEGELAGGHYQFFFTEHFGLDRGHYAGKAILDVGCGPRGSLEWAGDAARRVGLDPLADDYRELGIEAHAMEYVAAPAERMPLPDRSFDVVSSFNSLDHVDDVDRALGEIARVLRPGGLFLCLTDVGHEPTVEEPQSFGWGVGERLGPELEVVRERRFESTGSSLYDALLAGVAWDGDREEPRPGVLSLMCRKRV